VKKIIVAIVAGGVLLTGCGGTSSGGYTQHDAPTNRNYTTVDVNGNRVDVTQTTLYGYTCLVGANDNYYHDYSPTIWCDPNSKKATP
jgi:hypothetical protein